MGDNSSNCYLMFHRARTFKVWVSVFRTSSSGVQPDRLAVSMLLNAWTGLVWFGFLSVTHFGYKICLRSFTLSSEIVMILALLQYTGFEWGCHLTFFFTLVDCKYFHLPSTVTVLAVSGC